MGHEEEPLQSLNKKKSSKKEPHVVQFIADDLCVAFVVVPAGHSELQRPQLTVVNLSAESTHTGTDNEQHQFNICLDVLNTGF